MTAHLSASANSLQQSEHVVTTEEFTSTHLGMVWVLQDAKSVCPLQCWSPIYLCNIDEAGARGEQGDYLAAEVADPNGLAKALVDQLLERICSMSPI